MKYKVIVELLSIERHIIEANSEEEAEQLALAKENGELIDGSAEIVKCELYDIQ